MAKLEFKEENAQFELEVGDVLFTGTLNDLTPEQKDKQNKALKPIRAKNEIVSKLFSKINRLQIKLKTKTHLQEWDSVDKLETEIFKLQDEIAKEEDWLKKNYDQEAMFKERLSVSIESGYLESILKAGEKHGYENVFNTILLDIKERNKKKPLAVTNTSSN